MTRAVCIVCGGSKMGAWTQCSTCTFRPQTVLELVTALNYSDQGQYRSQLGALPDLIKRQTAALEKGGPAFTVDHSVIQMVLEGIKNPSFRDVLTLKRSAKDGLFSKQINVHEIGPDGYNAHVLTRGKNLDRVTFDAVRSSPDRDLFVVITYQNGQRQSDAVSKDRWYAMYDMMLLVERQAMKRSLLQRIYEQMCREFLENFLTKRTLFD